ncbi:MAG TPA: ATP-binding protein [Anaerolineales bacterium]|nr:ATP-binding protein [Anaerolineales bacterium]
MTESGVIAARILITVSDPGLGQYLEETVLSPEGYDLVVAANWGAAQTLLAGGLPDLLLLDEALDEHQGLARGREVTEQYPALPVILLVEKPVSDLLLKAIRSGFADILELSVGVDEMRAKVAAAITRGQRIMEWALNQTHTDTRILRERLTNLEILQRVGRQVTSQLELDQVLTAVVDAAVDLTGAEEGSLLLLDEESGELYMRAARNFQEDFVRTFRLAVDDSLAGQVIQTGQPVLVDHKTPKKIKTAYLIHTLIYVPMTIQKRVIGVLGVDNRQTRQSFSDYHLSLMSALADYAAIAIENARLYSRTEVERSKLETLLTQIEEGVIVVDHDRRVMLINRVARANFGLDPVNLTGRPIEMILHHPEVLELLAEENITAPARAEINLEDGRVLIAQLTPIQEVGLALTMQDITHLKELDRIKTDFVNTVSHDLRSPLTAILGYVELVERVGQLTEQQKEFLHRVQLSVHSITALINDLLDLGRIEAGFDTRKEFTPLAAILRYALDGLRARIEEKNLDVIIDAPENLPPLLGNPIRLRQMLGNLVGNAVKYAPVDGKVWVRIKAEGEQVIIQVEDNGLGIPQPDLPYIFDKFYRGSNVPQDLPGTGLGLAIVRSIVENHRGRIWAESMMEKGSIFTVVLPTADNEL